MLDLIYRDERICLFCKEVKEKKLAYLCQDCFDQLTFKSEFFDLKGYDAVYSVLEYDKILRTHLFPYKYSHRSYYYKVLGDIMVYELEDKGLFEDVDLILAVPLTRRKKALRGYNQSGLLAGYLGEKMGIPVVEDLVYKVRTTKDQHELTSLERKRNLRDAFQLAGGDRIRGRRILVLDDVLTTGTTLERIGELILDYGPQALYGLTLAAAK